MGMAMAISSVARELAELAAGEATERAQRLRGSHSSAAARWYVAHGAGNDRRAKETLERANFEVYYPTEAIMTLVPRNQLSQKQRRSAIPQYKRVLKPFFPRYFFVRFDLARGDWHEVFDLAGLHGIICTDGGARPLPAPIADSEITRVRSKEVGGVIPRPIVDTTVTYDLGEEVRISTGPFTGHNGIVSDIPSVRGEPLDESSRLKLLVSLFGRASVVEMALADIEKL